MRPVPNLESQHLSCILKATQCTPSAHALPSLHLLCTTDHIAVNGSAAIVTPNASLLIEGVAGPVVTANAGICNLRLPLSGQLQQFSAQPCLITRSAPLAQAQGAVAAVAQAASAFNQTCGFDKQYESEGCFSATGFDTIRASAQARQPAVCSGCTALPARMLVHFGNDPICPVHRLLLLQCFRTAQPARQNLTRSLACRQRWQQVSRCPPHWQVSPIPKGASASAS